MYTEFYTTAVSGMLARQRQMDILTNNLANVNTTGFKMEEAVFSERRMETRMGPVSVPSHVEAMTRYIDFTQGRLSPTGNPADLALDGEGFFVVETPDGTRLTRNGRFALDTEGRLTLGGLPVMGENGEIKLKNEPFKVEGDGSIKQGGLQSGRLRVVTVDNPQALIKDEAGLYEVPADMALRDAENVKVLQAQLEMSNTDGIRQMVQMIELVRAFEMHQRMIRTVDELTEKAVTLLGRTT